MPTLPTMQPKYLQLYSGPEKFFWHVRYKTSLWLLNLNVNLRLSLSKKFWKCKLKILKSLKRVPRSLCSTVVRTFLWLLMSASPRAAWKSCVKMKIYSSHLRYNQTLWNQRFLASRIHGHVRIAERRRRKTQINAQKHGKYCNYLREANSSLDAERHRANNRLITTSMT